MAQVYQNFQKTAAVQSFIVPVGVTELIIECWGAWGGSIWTNNFYQSTDMWGGAPEYTIGTLAVTPGDTYFITVGGQGGVPLGGLPGGAGGFNGGGSGGAGPGTVGPGGTYFLAGAGGGGASDIRHGGSALANRIMVAAGGGGIGGDFGAIGLGTLPWPNSPYPYGTSDSWNPHVLIGPTNRLPYAVSGTGVGGNGVNGTGATTTPGQDGGHAAYMDSAGSWHDSGVGTQGGGGAATAGGTAGVVRSGATGATSGTVGALGVGGNGGNAAGSYGNNMCGGGGGGGGYYGGGGGAGESQPTSATIDTNGGGGGAGSSYISTGFTSPQMLGPTPVPMSQSDLDGWVLISYIQPPNTPTPTITTPNNSGVATNYDQTQPLSFAWQFSTLSPGNYDANGNFSPEAQSRFDIQYSSNAGSTWTVITEPGNTSDVYTFAAGFFTAGTNYLVQVRVYDLEAVPSAWSSSVAFEMVALTAAPTITAPTANQVITASPFNVAWTIPAGTQTDYQVQISDSEGHLLLDSGDVASAAKTYSASLSFSFVSGTELIISVRYKISTGGGVWSSITKVIAIPNLSPPATPTVIIGTDDISGVIALNINNPSTPNATVSMDIYRTDLTNDTPEMRVATGVSPSVGSGTVTWIDYTPGSGIFYQYRVRAYSALGGVADAT